MWNKYNWDRFKSLDKIKNLTPQEQARQYFLYQSNMIREAYNPSVASSSAGAGGSGNRRYPIFTEATKSEIIMVKTFEHENFQYYVLDYTNNVINGPVDSKINSTEYSVYGYKLIQDGGYTFWFKSNSDYNVNVVLFMEASGTVVEKLDYTRGLLPTSDLSVNSWDGKWITVDDYDGRLLWIFDGKTVTKSDAVKDTTGYSFGSYNLESATGGLLLKRNTIDGSSFDILNNDGLTNIISVTNSKVTYEYTSYSRDIVYSFVTDAATDYYQNLYIKNFNGETLNTITFSSIDSLIVRSSNNKFNFVGWESGTRVYQIYRYDELLNQILFMTYSNVGAQNVEILSRSQPPGSFSSYPLTDTVVFHFNNVNGYLNGLMSVTFSSFIYCLGDDNTFQSYTYSDGTPKYISSANNEILVNDDVILIPSSTSSNINIISINLSSVDTLPLSAQGDISGQSIGSNFLYTINSSSNYLYLFDNMGRTYSYVESSYISYNNSYDTVCVFTSTQSFYSNRENQGSLVEISDQFNTNISSTPYTTINNLSIANHMITGGGTSSALLITPTASNSISIENGFQNVNIGPNYYFIWYFDSNRDNKVTAELYDLSGNLLQKVETPDFTKDWFDLIEDRAAIRTYTKVMGDVATYIWNIYLITPNEVKSTSFKTYDNLDNVDSLYNDWTWFINWD